MIRLFRKFDWLPVAIPITMIVSLIGASIFLPMTCQIDAWDYSDLDRKRKECPEHLNPLILKAMEDDDKISEWEYYGLKSAHDQCRAFVIKKQILKK